MSRAGTPLISTRGLHHTYGAGTKRAALALRGIDLTIHAGEYVALIGANGSGKSTLLRHLNALLLPTRGDVWIAGWNTRETSHLRDIRSTVSMVFQVPDSQIVATVVEEDVAFGPENLGIPARELRERVDWALELVGLADLRQRPSHLLSTGQKQRLAIASALAMRPRCLLLDEATAMLDPMGRDQLLQTIAQLHSAGLTIMSITHQMLEAARADRIIVLSKGRVALEGTPRTVFGDPETLGRLQLDLPQPTLLARLVASHVDAFPTDVLTVPELVEAAAARLCSPPGNSQ